MNFAGLARFSAIALLVTAVATIAVMWHPGFWATALPEVLAFGLAAVWVVALPLSGKAPRGAFVLPALVAAAFWPLLQLATGSTIYRLPTSTAVLYWACGAALVFVGLQVFDDSRTRRWYLRGLLITGFVLAVVGPLQLFTAGDKVFWLFDVKSATGVAPIGPFVYSNQYAAFVELVLPIALTGVFTDRSGWRSFHGLAAAVLYASIFASASREGFILTTLEIIVVPLLAAKRASVPAKQLIVSAGIFVGMLAVLGLAVGPEKLLNKLGQKNPYGGRLELTESSLQMIRDRPLIGVGLGNWAAAYPVYATFDEGYFANQAHNDWAQWAAEGGIPFVLIIFGVAVWSVPRAWRSGWGFGVPVVFLQCLADYPIQRMGVAVVFFTLLGAIAHPDVVERGWGGGRDRQPREAY